TCHRRRPARRGVRAVLALLLLGAGTCARAYEWDVDVTPAGELFPALDLSQAPADDARARGGGNGLVGVRLRGEDLPPRLRLEVRTPGLARAAVLAFE